MIYSKICDNIKENGGEIILTKIYGHRGSSGICPENTLLSFRTAIEQGADGIELDVHLTKDGIPIVIHDEMLERTTNGAGFVKNFTVNELQAFDAGNGETIPTLREVLHLLDGTSVELNIELKTTLLLYEGIEEKVLSVVQKFGAGRKVVYSSFHLPTLLRLKATDNTANIAWLLEMGFPLPHPADCIETLNLEALHLGANMFMANPEHYSEVSDKIRIWTVNNPADAQALAAFGVAAIITDYPDRILAEKKAIVTKEFPFEIQK